MDRDRERDLPEFDYQVEKDFDVKGVTASWSTSGSSNPSHRYWGDEDENIQVDADGDDAGDVRSAISAMSPDAELIAVSSGMTIIVYHVKSRTFRSRFNVSTDPCVDLLFVSSEEGPGYRLVIASSDADERDEQIVFVDLDEYGRKDTKVEPLKVEEILQKSLDPVVEAIDQSFGLASSSQLLESIRADYTTALKKLQSRLGAIDLPKARGSISGFGSQPLSPDGRFLLYLSNNETTQHGARPPAELPQIVVYDITTHTQKHVLAGFEDAIMWTAFSPDGKYIASACWDGTFRIFDAVTGDCKHLIGPTGSQCWSGEWSPDSKHVLLSGMGMTGPADCVDSRSYSLVAVYSVETGEQVSRLQHERLRHWVRRIAWSGRGDIAIVHEADVWIWKPFEDTFISSFAVKLEDRRNRGWSQVVAITELMWVDDGQILIVRDSQSTIEVWHRFENVHWRFQKPQGLSVEGFCGTTSYIAKERTIVSFSSDGCLRFWKL